MAHSLLLMNRK